jgi:L-ascorbate metabolism protein UlaG (beta-lactamase superfamily)
MEITWLGHASFMIKEGSKVIYIDPYSGDDYGKADLILVSHAHYDHASMEKIRMASADETVIMAPKEIASGIDGSIEIREGNEHLLDNIKIRAVPMYSRTHARGEGVGFVLNIRDIRLYFAGDSGLMDEMKNIKADVALLPVGGTYTMDAREAAEAAVMIKPRLAIPMHYGSIVGTKDDAELFREYVESRSDIVVRIMEHGESIRIK